MLTRIALLLSFCFLAACGGGGASLSPLNPVVSNVNDDGGAESNGGGEASLSAVPTEFTATEMASGEGEGEKSWVGLAWKSVSDADGYRIYRDGVLIAIAGSSRSAYAEETKETSASAYKIEAFFGAPVSVAVAAPPDATADKPAGAKVVLRWEFPEFVPEDRTLTGWQIWRNNEKIAEIKDLEATSWTDENPGEAGSYYYNIFILGTDLTYPFRTVDTDGDGNGDARPSMLWLYNSARADIAADASEIDAASHNCGRINISGCIEKTMSDPIAHSGDAAGLYDGEREGDAFPRNDPSSRIFANACLPDGKCRDLPAIIEVPPGGRYFGSFVVRFWAESHVKWRRGELEPLEEGSWLLTGASLEYANPNKPEYAALGGWYFRVPNENKDWDDFRYGYSIFADNTVAPPSAGTAHYDVRATVQYNAPLGNNDDTIFGGDKFMGAMSADFAAATIGGRLTNSGFPIPIVSRESHLDFNGRIANDCAAGAVCFSGQATLSATSGYQPFFGGFDGKSGTFQGAFYDDPDYYDGQSAPADIGGVFGGLFNEDGGELIGGFLGGLADE